MAPFTLLGQLLAVLVKHVEGLPAETVGEFLRVRHLHQRLLW